ncbi:unnamed protein product [Somion occarium]|uniref:Restriction of telomere capping protein 4 n=1 Tax=Somion occarium TaxID=3059160 RepID=A0ABP1E6Y3_9APHY
MENLMNDLKSRGQTIDTAKSESVRMAKRPVPPSSRGHVFVDLGSDFGSKDKDEATVNGHSTAAFLGPKERIGRSSSQKSMSSQTSRSGKLSRNPIDEIYSDSSSDDELDIIGFATPRDRTTSKKGPDESSRHGKAGPSTTGRAGIALYQVHTREGDLKNLKFTKKSKAKDIDESQGSRSTPEISEQIMVDGELYEYRDEREPVQPKKSKPSTATSRKTKPTKMQPVSAHRIPDKLRKPFKPPSRVVSRSETGSSSLNAVASSSSGSPSNPSRLGRDKSLPSRQQSSSDTAKDRPPRASLSRLSTLSISIEDLVRDDDSKDASQTASRPKPRPKPRRADRENEVVDPDDELPALAPTKPQPRGFPMETLSPVSRDDAGTPKAKKTGKGKERADNFPVLSPLCSQQSNPLSRTSSQAMSEMQGFPNLSPLTSPARAKAAKSRRTKAGVKVSGRRVESTSECTDSSEDERHPRYRPRPFPMGTQVLETINSSPLKRTSEDDDPGVFRKKRRKRGGHEILNELMDSGDDDDNLHFMDPNMDHSTLCPWCDEPLPPVPSPHLKSLIRAARQRSFRDARPTNPLGLRAPLPVFVAVCQRHTFERVQIPLAQQRGWPMSIQWEDVGHRVRQLAGTLRKIVDDVDEDWLPGHVTGPSEGEDNEDDAELEDEELQGERPRKGSLFWRDVIRNVKTKGSRQAAGVRNQFSNFSKTQPGYYGELGYVIIHQTIYDLFPPDSLDADSTLPLTPTEFIQLILVPEAAVCLIIDDLQQNRPQAIRTLRESAGYGVAMFPDDHVEGGVSKVEAGEDIVRERAKARRKALEAEEAEEFSETTDVADAVVSNPARKRKGRTRKKDEDDDVVMLTDSSRSNVRKPPQPRKRKLIKSETMPGSSQPGPSIVLPDDVVDLCSSTDSMSMSKGEAPKPRPKPRRRVRGLVSDSGTNDGAQLLLTDTDMSDFPGSGSHTSADKAATAWTEPPKTDDVDATPKPRRVFSRTLSASSSTLAVVGAAAKGDDKLTPLERARMRNSQQSDGWSRNLRDVISESDDVDESDASHTLRSSRRLRSKRS